MYGNLQNFGQCCPFGPSDDWRSLLRDIFEVVTGIPETARRGASNSDSWPGETPEQSKSHGILAQSAILTAIVPHPAAPEFKVIDLAQSWRRDMEPSPFPSGRVETDTLGATHSDETPLHVNMCFFLNSVKPERYTDGGWTCNDEV